MSVAGSKQKLTSSRAAFVAISFFLLWPGILMADRLPSRFIGVWMLKNDKKVSCNSGDWKGDTLSDVSIHLFQPNRISGFEYGCDLLSVKRSKSEPEAITAEFDCGGEGFVWRETTELRIRNIRWETQMKRITKSGRRIAGDGTPVKGDKGHITTETYQKCGKGGSTRFSASSPIRTDKILWSSHMGNATVISVKGQDSDRAKVIFHRELDDEVETCVREHPREDDKESDIAAACVREVAKVLNRQTTTRRADCSRATLYTEFGNFSMTSHTAEVREYNRQTMLRTDWKDHSTGKLIGNCGGCNTPRLIDTLRVLCPKLYNELSKEGIVY